MAGRGAAAGRERKRARSRDGSRARGRGSGPRGRVGEGAAHHLACRTPDQPSPSEREGQGREWRRRRSWSGSWRRGCQSRNAMPSRTSPWNRGRTDLRCEGPPRAVPPRYFLWAEQAQPHWQCSQPQHWPQGQSHILSFLLSGDRVARAGSPSELPGEVGEPTVKVAELLDPPGDLAALVGKDLSQLVRHLVACPAAHIVASEDAGRGQVERSQPDQEPQPRGACSV